MKSIQDVDVVIVGAGPAGSACATVLSRSGVSVLLVDKARFPREKICGDCINPKCWELFEALGVADELRMMQLHVIDAVRVTNSQGATISSLVSNHPPSPFFSIARGELDTVLLREAQRSGAMLLEETSVVDIQWDKRWHVVTRGGQSASRSTVSARFLVGADGRNSIVARKLSEDSYRANGRNKTKSGEKARVGIQWYAHYQPRIDSALEMFLFDSGYGGVVNVDEKRANVAMVTTPELAQLAKTDVQSFLSKTLLSNVRASKRLDDLQPLGDISAASPIFPSSHRSHHRAAFLVGDARRTVEPFTGEGIFFALQDGFSTALRLLNVIQPFLHAQSHFLDSRFWVNQIYSQALQHQWLADRLVAFGEKIPILIPFAAKPILSMHVVS
ncbi:MAG: geranylgeranyl reductase family protein [Bacteroidota bacterium]